MLNVTRIRTADGVYLYRVEGRNPERLEHGIDTTDIVILDGKKRLVFIGDKLPPKHATNRANGFVFVNVASILSNGATNIKQAKTQKRFHDVVSVIYYGAPAGSAGLNIFTCSHASRECAEFCLNTAGKGTLLSVQLSRIARSRLQAFAPAVFWIGWKADLAKAKRKAVRESKRLACRPNGTTDQFGQELRTIIRENSDIRFYDYTAVPSRMREADSFENYDIVFSRKETKSNLEHVRAARTAGFNLAVVVEAEVKRIMLRAFPESFVDFDEHDLRLNDVDGHQVIGLLTPKGRMRGKSNSTSMTYDSVNRLRVDMGV